MSQVLPIREAIEKTVGVKCWMDLKAIESGSKRFTKDIINGINNCHVFLFILTENSQHSEFALRELDFADKKGKKVVIVNVNNCVMSDEFQFLYGLTDTILWTDEPQREKLLRDLMRWAVTENSNPGIIPNEKEKEILKQEVEENISKAPSSLATISLILGILSLVIAFVVANQLNTRYLKGLPLQLFDDISALKSVLSMGVLFNIGGFYLNINATKRAKKNRTAYKSLFPLLNIGRVLHLISAGLWVFELIWTILVYTEVL